VIPVAISTAGGWNTERDETLRRLVNQLDVQPTILTSMKPEHGSVWGRRAIEWAAKQEGPCVLLEDDVTVPYRFTAAVWAMLPSSQGSIVSLATLNPEAAEIRRSTGHRFIQSYWITTCGWVLRPGVADEILAFLDAMGDRVRDMPFDNSIILWAGSRRQPMWSPIPALVRHDPAVPSLVNPYHGPRTTPVQWEQDDLIYEPSWWRQHVEPPFVPCAWAEADIAKWEAR
jgi:hypothetical protein